MEVRELVSTIEQAFGGAVTGAAEETRFPFVGIKPESIKDVLRFCLENPALQMDFLECMTASDSGQDIVLVYQLYSTILSHRLNVKAALDRHAPRIDSVTELWKAAGNYEREIAEMLGVSFSGHPSLERLLLPEGWQGFPLRKDYVYPDEFATIEHRRQPQRKEHARP